MKSERKEALLAIKENIEMKLFSSEELCTVIQTQEEKEDHTVDQVSEILLKVPSRKNQWVPGLFDRSSPRYQILQEAFIQQLLQRNNVQKVT